MVNYLGRTYKLPDSLPAEFLEGDIILNVQTDIDDKNTLHLSFVRGILISIEIWNLDRCTTDLKLLATAT